MSLVLYDHQYWYKKRVEDIRNNQTATALQTAVLEQLILAVAGNKPSGNKTIEDYLPIKMPLDNDNPVYHIVEHLKDGTYGIYQKLCKQNIIPAWLDREFVNNEKLLEAFEHLKSSQSSR